MTVGSLPESTYVGPTLSRGRSYYFPYPLSQTQTFMIIYDFIYVFAYTQTHTHTDKWKPQEGPGQVP